MKNPLIVVDTDVLVSALRSRNGASFQVIEALPLNTFEIAVSVPLVMEYESVLLRAGMVPISSAQVGDFLDYVCMIARHQRIHFLWRPTLPDPKDDMVLELAVNAEVSAIVTHNVSDFREAARFGIRVETPREFLMERKRSTP